MNQQKKERKYRNNPCEVGGIKFDSQKERERFLELKMLFEQGVITELRLQQHFTLQEAFKDVSGEFIRRLEYIADFTYMDSSGRLVIEDVKSDATRKDKTYRLKKKLMAGKGYKITEV